MPRYIIVLDRYDDDDNCGPDGHTPRTDEEGITQVAAELQDAMIQTGQPAGFFNVVARLQHTPGVSERDPDAVLAEVMAQIETDPAFLGRIAPYRIAALQTAIQLHLQQASS